MLYETYYVLRGRSVQSGSLEHQECIRDLITPVSFPEVVSHEGVRSDCSSNGKGRPLPVHPQRPVPPNHEIKMMSTPRFRQVGMSDMTRPIPRGLVIHCIKVH